MGVSLGYTGVFVFISKLGSTDRKVLSFTIKSIDGLKLGLEKVMDVDSSVGLSEGYKHGELDGSLVGI